VAIHHLYAMAPDGGQGDGLAAKCGKSIGDICDDAERCWWTGADGEMPEGLVPEGDEVCDECEPPAGDDAVASAESLAGGEGQVDGDKHPVDYGAGPFIGERPVADIVRGPLPVAPHLDGMPLLTLDPHGGQTHPVAPHLDDMPPITLGPTSLGSTKGRKHDAGRDPWDLFPWAAATEIVKVLEHGRQKYAAENWRHVRPLRRRYFAALMRHTLAWARGERDDPDTGLHHLAHAGCCLMFILEFEVAPSNAACAPALEPPAVPDA